MKNKMLYVPMAMAVMSALVVTATTTTTTTTTTTATTTTATTTTATTTTATTIWPTTTTGASGLNLNGKMFTLSFHGGVTSFYPPYFSPRPYTTTTRPYITTKPTTTTPRSYPTTTRPYTTTAPATRGVSVCLRYLADSLSELFTLSPSSRNPLRMETGHYDGYILTLDRYGYYTLPIRPNVKFWSNVGPDIWTRVCLTVDSYKNVAQVFSSSNMSIRKMLPIRFVWSGEPVIDISGFDGQVTDIQIWDYPLRYREVFNYMTGGVYGPYRGSALTWSYISFSPAGNALLEDTYEMQARQPISSSRGMSGRRPQAERKTRKFSSVGESKRKHLK